MPGAPAQPQPAASSGIPPISVAAAVAGAILLIGLMGVVIEPLFRARARRMHQEQPAGEVVQLTPRVGVSGQVVDAVTGKPVAGARIADVFLDRGSDRAVRESLGRTAYVALLRIADLE